VHGETVTLTEPQLLEIFAALHGYRFKLGQLIELYTELARRVDSIAALMIGAAKRSTLALPPPWTGI
jgi:hypothetical protein